MYVCLFVNFEVIEMLTHLKICLGLGFTKMLLVELILEFLVLKNKIGVVTPLRCYGGGGRDIKVINRIYTWRTVLPVDGGWVALPNN